MPTTHTLELHFAAAPVPRLTRTVFHWRPIHGGRAHGPFVACEFARAAPGMGAARTFQPTRGLRAFALALVRLRARRGAAGVKTAGTTPWTEPLLEGGRGSAAAVLDAVLLRPDGAGWLRAILDPRHATGGNGSLKARLDGWFQRRNSNLNDRSQPVRVFARAPGHAASLTPEEVVVFVGGVLADPARLAAVENALTVGFTDGWDAAGGVVFSGTPTLPAEMAAEPFVGREQERAWLAAIMSGWSRRLVQVVAPGGVGKTGLVATWLREAMAAGPAGGFAFRRVFRWDFHREAASVSAPSETWRKALAAALGVRLPVGGSPAEVAGMLATALLNQRTLLVLDGLEVALFPPGDARSGEFRDGALPLLLDALFPGEGEGDRENAPGCILTTRRAMREWPAGAGAATLELPGLADGVSRALLRQLEVEASEEETAAVVRFAGGRPLLLRRLAGPDRTGQDVFRP